MKEKKKRGPTMAVAALLAVTALAACLGHGEVEADERAECIDCPKESIVEESDEGDECGPGCEPGIRALPDRAELLECDWIVVLVRTTEEAYRGLLPPEYPPSKLLGVVEPFGIEFSLCSLHTGDAFVSESMRAAIFAPVQAPPDVGSEDASDFYLLDMFVDEHSFAAFWMREEWPIQKANFTWERDANGARVVMDSGDIFIEAQLLDRQARQDFSSLNKYRFHQKTESSMSFYDSDVQLDDPWPLYSIIIKYENYPMLSQLDPTGVGFLSSYVFSTTMSEEIVFWGE